MRTFPAVTNFIRSGLQRACLVGLGFLLVVPLCEMAASAQDQDDFSTLFQQAAEQFRPVTDQQVSKARAKLLKRMNTLQRFLRPDSANARRWKHYLRWDSLSTALADEGQADFRPLAETYQRLNRDENGLELPPFRRLASALRRYTQLRRLQQQPDQQAFYRGQLERLQTQLDEYRRQPNARAGFEIGNRLGLLADLGEAPELISAVRRQFSQPNAYLEVSTALVAAAAEPIDRHEPVTDCILGTTIHSQTHTVGQVGVASIPSQDSAVLEFISQGQTFSRSVGRNGPAVIRSTSVTDFSAVKRVELSDAFFRAGASRARATTHSNILSVSKAGGGLGSRLVSSIGWNRVCQNKSRADAIAADHAEDRIDRRFDRELNDKLRDARRQYEDEYRRPLARRGAMPDHIRFSSARDHLAIEVTQANQSQLGASGPPPAAPPAHDLSVRLHESAVNNYSAILLGGATASETAPGEEVKFDVKLPEWMKDAWQQRKSEGDQTATSEQPFKPYALRFRDARPLSVSFADGKVELTIHVARLQSGDRTFTNWDVTGSYVPELANGGIVLRRVGDLVMLPADFRGTLSSRQAAERRNLEEELNQRSAQGRGFPRTVEFEPLKPEGALANAGPLELRHCTSENGWLTLAWSRQGSGR